MTVGGVLFAILDKARDCIEHSVTLDSIAGRCRSVNYLSRPSAKEVLTLLEEVNHDNSCTFANVPV